MSLILASTVTAFNVLPIELNKNIAQLLEADEDIKSFALICRSTYYALYGDNESFWRVKFRHKYALKEGVSNAALRRQYQRRAKLLRLGTGYNFYRGHGHRELKVLEVLRDLIKESFQGATGFDSHGRPQCNNQRRLIDFIRNSKILLENRRPPRPQEDEPDEMSPFLAAIKLVCSHFLFDLKEAKNKALAVEESQQAVYAATSKAPIFVGSNKAAVNMQWALHCMNFFRHHMLDTEAQTLCSTMIDLAPIQKPSPWQEPLRPGAYPMNKHWKGTYAYLDYDDLRRLRTLSASRKVELQDVFFNDGNIDEGKIQSLELDFIENGTRPWPTLFEDRLHSLRDFGAPRTRAQQRTASVVDKPKNLMFTGCGEDLEDSFFATGWLNQLPSQYGIPGWQRITFMKHFDENLDNVEDDNLWAYEGIVLPGGRIILGRWWFASDDVDFNSDYNGPFILWAVTPDAELADTHSEDVDAE